MSTDSITVTGVVPAHPAEVYAAFLDAEQHGAMTGGAMTSAEDGSFSAWNGYITGRTLQTEEGKRIVQAWRTAEFPADAPDSRLEIVLEPADGGTRVTFQHSEIPAGQGVNYQQGWVDHYLDPMRDWFTAR